MGANNIFLLASTIYAAKSMSAAFSSDAEAAIARPLDLEEQERRTGIQRRKEDDLSIAEFYEIDQTATEIQSRQLKRVINIHLQVDDVLSEPKSADCVAVPR
jgi:hypothetical protein